MTKDWNYGEWLAYTGNDEKERFICQECKSAIRLLFDEWNAPKKTTKKKK
jgi:hypothetical protein